MDHERRNLSFLSLAVLISALAFSTWACDGGGAAGADDDDDEVADAGGIIVPEPCNGVDDDGDGRVDEGCTCVLNSTQACWPGDPSNRGIGECKDGIQRCQGEVEFSQWSPCEGYVLPQPDFPGNGVDENCDGGDGDNCEETGPEICNNDLDDDCDGDTDCRDSDCDDFPACGDCVSEGAETCDDGVDNDCDGLIDCEDVDDCYDEPWACTCIKQCPPGSIRWCDDPTYCLWGKQTCNPDGTWGACVETPERPDGCEGSVLYNPICCVEAGECCQALPSGDSIGECPPGEIVCEET